MQNWYRLTSTAPVVLIFFVQLSYKREKICSKKNYVMKYISSIKKKLIQIEKKE